MRVLTVCDPYLKSLCLTSQLFKVNIRLCSAFLIERILQISLTLPIGYATISLLCSPTNGKFKWPANFVGTCNSSAFR